MREKDGRDQSFGITRFLPIHGDDVLPVSAMKALEDGAGAEIDLLIGTMREEANLFFAPLNGFKKINRFVARYFLSRMMRRSKEALIAYGMGKKGVSAGVALAGAVTDLMFRWPNRQTAFRHKGRARVYEFEWRSPALGGQLGAAHALDIPFVFDTLAVAAGPKGFLRDNPPQELADRVRALWIGFATDGSLPWPPYDQETRQVYSIMRKTSALEPVMPAADFLP
jgi:para-nitrobenzyl esterase